MGYFDSPKNKAIWEKEITRLEMEREKREQSDISGGRQIEESREDNEEVKEITLAELEIIVRKEKGLPLREPESEMRKRAERANEREEIAELAADRTGGNSFERSTLYK